LAEAYLQDAVARDPTDTQAWQLLALLEGSLRQLRAARLAAERAVDLDPMGRFAQGVVARQLSTAPPGYSATRYP
jgi:Tfp pilus assembly protein PilF